MGWRGNRILSGLGWQRPRRRGSWCRAHAGKLRKQLARTRDAVGAVTSGTQCGSARDAAFSSFPPPRGAIGSTTSVAVDVTTAVVDVGSEVGRPNDEKPWVVVNSEGYRCAHWERRSPPLADSLATFDGGGFRYDVPRSEFRVATLVSFFERLHCGERLTPPREEPFTWSRGANAALGDQMHSHGRWFRFAYREPHPAALPGTDTSDPFVWRHAWYDYERCIHSTSVYNVPKVLRDGLLPGGREGKGSVQGVYCYPMEGVALAAKSSDYCVYSSPCEDGWFWGFRCELQVAKGMSYQKKIHVGARQYAAWLGSYSVCALWVHVIHQDDIRAAYSEDVRLYYNVDRWNPQYLEP